MVLDRPFSLPRCWRKPHRHSRHMTRHSELGPLSRKRDRSQPPLAGQPRSKFLGYHLSTLSTTIGSPDIVVPSAAPWPSTNSINEETLPARPAGANLSSKAVYKKLVMIVASKDCPARSCRLCQLLSSWFS